MKRLYTDLDDYGDDLKKLGIDAKYAIANALNKLPKKFKDEQAKNYVRVAGRKRVAKTFSGKSTSSLQKRTQRAGPNRLESESTIFTGRYDSLVNSISVNERGSGLSRTVVADAFGKSYFAQGAFIQDRKKGKLKKGIYKQAVEIKNGKKIRFLKHSTTFDSRILGVSNDNITKIQNHFMGNIVIDLLQKK